MATTTTNYGFKKPDVTDLISPTPYNDNFDKLDSMLAVKEITLGTTWTTDSANGYVTQTVTVSGITADSRPSLDVKMSGNLDNMESIEEEWAKIKSATTGNGNITFIASEATTKSLTITVKG